MKKTVLRLVFDAVPSSGRYERDILVDHVKKHSQRDLEAALGWLRDRGYIRKTGDGQRPVYFRTASSTVVYDQLAPLDDYAVIVMLEAHNGIQRKATTR